METFSALLAICAGSIHRSPVNSVNYPHKGQWRGALMFSLICTRINGWVNNGEAGDLRCYHAHYDITVMPPFAIAMLYVISCYNRSCYKEQCSTEAVKWGYLAPQNQECLDYFWCRGPCPHKFEIINANIIELTPEELPMVPYFSMEWINCPHLSETLAEPWRKFHCMIIIPPLHRRWNAGILDSPWRPCVRPSIRLKSLM